MAIINLRDYYPFYTSDCFMEVSEEVADIFYCSRHTILCFYVLFSCILCHSIYTLCCLPPTA